MIILLTIIISFSRSVDVTPAIIKSAIVRAPASLADAKGFEQYDGVFMQLCDDRKTINSFELQELLETCLPNGEWRIEQSLAIEIGKRITV